jgi:hypothetical protein
MFPPAPQVDPRLAPAIEALEAAAPARRVISARLYRLPVARLRARVAIQHPRRFNILEEFVLRAAAELEPPPTAEELAALLGLDALFIERTLEQLEALKAITRVKGAAVSLTAQGRQFAAQGHLLQPADHKPFRFEYRAGVDDLAVAGSEALPAADPDLPLLPGLPGEARERLAAQAQAAVKLKPVIAALNATGLDLHQPAEGRLVTGVDQVAVDDLGFQPVGVLVAHDAATGMVTPHLVKLDGSASPLEAGRLDLQALLPGGTTLPQADGPYAERLRAALQAGAEGEPPEIEVLRASTHAERVRQLRAAIGHTVLLLYPSLPDPDAAARLRADLDGLAARGVLVVVGWGVAEEPEQEPRGVAPEALEALHSLRDPDGLPLVAAWHLGGLYGQDALLDETILVTSPQSRGAEDTTAPTYIITAGDLVAAAVDDLEPAFARAARLAWADAARAPAAQRATLVRCCLTWVAVRRPGEALSHVLKLLAALAEAGEPAEALVAWECLAAIGLALGRGGDSASDEAAGRQALGASDLRRALPEFLDWSDSMLPPDAAEMPPFVAAMRGLLEAHGLVEAGNLPGLLARLRQLWREHGAPEAEMSFSAAFRPPSERDALPRTARPKKRRS